MKNILRENMRRFGTKNLNEQETPKPVQPIDMDLTKLKPLRSHMLKLIQIASQDAGMVRGMVQDYDYLIDDIKSAFSSMNINDLVELFTKMSTDTKFMNWFINSMEFEDKFKPGVKSKLQDTFEYINQRMKKLQGLSVPAPNVTENIITIDLCPKKEGQELIDCIIGTILSTSKDLIDYIDKYEKAMGKTNRYDSTRNDYINKQRK
tara:strand:+ start:234 stop:851 length:618 start_codon:yes stop_codon:yes gene_type:complete